MHACNLDRGARGGGGYAYGPHDPVMAGISLPLYRLAASLWATKKQHPNNTIKEERRMGEMGARVKSESESESVLFPCGR